jgi:hypothetical protein
VFGEEFSLSCFSVLTSTLMLKLEKLVVFVTRFA